MKFSTLFPAASATMVATADQITITFTGMDLVQGLAVAIYTACDWADQRDRRISAGN